MLVVPVSMLSSTLFLRASLDVLIYCQLPSLCVQIIVPFSQVGRKNDIYVFCSSYRYDPDLAALPSILAI